MASLDSYEVDGRRRAQAAFEMFLELFSIQVVGIVEEAMSQATFLQNLTGEPKRLKSTLEERLIELLELATAGRPSRSMSGEHTSTQRTTSTKQLDQKDTSCHAGGSVGTGSEKIGARAGANISRGRGSSTESAMQTVEAGDAPHAARLGQFKNTLIDLLKMLKINRLQLLIDEWPALDGTSSTVVMQARFRRTPQAGLWRHQASNDEHHNCS